MKKRNIEIKRKIHFTPQKINGNKKINRNKKVNRNKKANRNKGGAGKKKDKKLYVWLLLGVLSLLGIGIALLALFRPGEEEEPLIEDDIRPALPEIETQDDRQEREQENQEKDREKKTKKTAGAAVGVLYLLLILGICIVPLLLFWVRPTETTAENRTMAALPEIRTAEGFNWNILSEAGAYFTDRFSFRQEMVSINAGIRSEVFNVSPVEDVIVGENGWLYYAATLDDYQHKNSISERMLFNIAHNTALMQEYSEGLGKTFVFTIAPNKNSLYGENMPVRLRYQVAEKSDAQRLLPWLVREGINYVDLFALFDGQEETLYYARDSHWNEKGAVMVYNALLDVCGKQHETYERAQPLQQTDYFGDLGVMLYPVGGNPEVRLQYPVGDTWRYVEGENVEDQFIRTENENGEGNLLMYRDSFGNSLLPYMAQAFSQTIFSRQVPYAMSDLVIYEPDILIVEKVERQLPTLGKVPPVMGAPVRETEKASVAAEGVGATVSLSKEDSYWKLEGLTDSAYMDLDSRIYVEVDDGSGAKLYEAFCVSSTDAEDGSTNDYGYILYISETQAAGDTFRIRVMTEREEAMVVLLTGELCALQDCPAKAAPEAGAAEEGETAVEGQTTTGTQPAEGQTGTGIQTGKDQKAEDTQPAEGQTGTGIQTGKDQKTTDTQSARGQTGTGIQTGKDQKAEDTQPAEGQTGTGVQTGKGQKTTDTQPARGQTRTGTKPGKGQKAVDAQPVQGQTTSETQMTQTRQEAQTQKAAQAEAETQAQKAAQAETESQAQKAAQAEAEAQAQKAAQAEAEAQAQKAAQMQAEDQQQGQQAVTEVNRVYMEDCGSDSGYWVITYSDGHVEYVDD